MGNQLRHRNGKSSTPLSKFTGIVFACVRIIRGPYLFWPDDWMDKDAIWYGGRPTPRPHCCRWGPNSHLRSSPPQRGTATQFSAHVCCGQTAGWIKMPLGKEVSVSSGHIVVDGDPAPLLQKGIDPTIFGPCLLWPNGWMDQDATW